MADYGKIISRSIETTKKFKWLWVYGLAIGIVSGGSSFSNFQIPDSATEKNFNFDQLPQDIDKPKEVLGAFTNSLFDWFAGVDPQTWSFLILGIVLCVLIGVAISWVLSSWANASLIGGLKLAHTDKEVNLKNTSPIGIANIKNLIVLGVIHIAMLIIGIVIIGIVAVIITILIGILGNDFAWLGVLFGIAAVVGLVYLIINYGLTLTYSQRYVVLEKYIPWNAWLSAWKLSTKNFFPSLVMGLIGGITQGAFGCVTNLILLAILGIPGYLILSPIISEKVAFPNWPSIITLIPLVMIFIFANILLRAILVVFNSSYWNLFFEEIESKFKEGSKK